jgi:hypothetical protein
MNATLAFPVWNHAHRAERVTNISPASDAFVLVTLATLFFTISCFALWMWVIWRRGQKEQPPRTEAPADEMQIHEPVSQSSEPIAGDAEEQPAPWEKPADWWKQ